VHDVSAPDVAAGMPYRMVSPLLGTDSAIVRRISSRMYFVSAGKPSMYSVTVAGLAVVVMSVLQL